MAQCVVRTLNQWLPARLRAQRVGGLEDSHMGTLRPRILEVAPRAAPRIALI